MLSVENETAHKAVDTNPNPIVVASADQRSVGGRARGVRER